MKVNPHTDLKSSFEDDPLFLLFYTSGGEGDRFVLPA